MGRYDWTEEQRSAVSTRMAGNRSRLAHGHNRRGRATPTYSSWQHMRTRCHNPNHLCYHRYGGRGITISARWDSFLNFLEDMGERPEGRELDRIDNDGNYEPGNCRWVTRAENMRNR